MLSFPGNQPNVQRSTTKVRFLCDGEVYGRKNDTTSGKFGMLILDGIVSDICAMSILEIKKNVRISPVVSVLADVEI